MNLSDHQPDIDQTLIDETLAHITDIAEVNTETHNWVTQYLGRTDVLQDDVAKQPEVWQMRYFTLVSMRTKEILIAALAQL